MNGILLKFWAWCFSPLSDGGWFGNFSTGVVQSKMVDPAVS